MEEYVPAELSDVKRGAVIRTSGGVVITVRATSSTALRGQIGVYTHDSQPSYVTLGDDRRFFVLRRS